MRDFELVATALNKEYAAHNAKADRSFLSLASKLLWLRYPHRAPIFDSQSARALLVLKRVMDAQENRGAPHRPKPDGKNKTEKDISRYRAFFDDYRAVYDQCRPDVERLAESASYPYPIRVFDKILWIVGKMEG